MSSSLKSSNISSGFVPQPLLEDVIKEIWFSEVVLTRLMLEWSKYDWTIKSIACLVWETLLSRAKWLVFFSKCFFENIYVMWVEHLS